MRLNKPPSVLDDIPEETKWQIKAAQDTKMHLLEVAKQLQENTQKAYQEQAQCAELMAQNKARLKATP